VGRRPSSPSTNSADAVAAGFRADIDDRIVRAFGGAGENLVLIGDAQAEHVDKNVAVVARVEIGLAADCRDADAIAVEADAADDAVDELARLRVIRFAEAQRVHDRDRARAHREHVAQDTANAGGCALERLDEARMVVALHLEDGGQTLADIDSAGILARPIDHVRGFGREFRQMHARRFVGAMLRPHHREDAQFGDVGGAAELFQDEVIFVAGETEFFGESQCAWRERV
jgi:hypothetical protein